MASIVVGSCITISGLLIILAVFTLIRWGGLDNVLGLTSLVGLIICGGVGFGCICGVGIYDEKYLKVDRSKCSIVNYEVVYITDAGDIFRTNKAKNLLMFRDTTSHVYMHLSLNAYGYVYKEHLEFRLNSIQEDSCVMERP